MLKTIFFTLQQAWLQLIAPPFCAYCKSFLPSNSIFCAPCTELIKPIVSTQLSISRTTKISIYAMSAYKEPIKSLILAKGYKNIVASRDLGHLMWEYTYLKDLDFDFIVPIPLHWTRFIMRGYNQAAEIAEILAQKSNKQIVFCLKRTRSTAYQATLSAPERKQNVNKVFSVTKVGRTTIQDKHILLVDDLLTTGATLQEAAKVLLKYKPKKITVVVAARVV